MSEMPEHKSAGSPITSLSVTLGHPYSNGKMTNAQLIAALRTDAKRHQGQFIGHVLTHVSDRLEVATKTPGGLTLDSEADIQPVITYGPPGSCNNCAGSTGSGDNCVEQYYNGNPVDCIAI